MTEQSFLPGDAAWVASDSPSSSEFSVVFEDDGDTGYFYAVRRVPGGGVDILDAAHVYNVRNVRDREIPSTARIVWSRDGLKAALLINDYAHAVVDFEAQRAYCRTNFPPPGGPWRAERREPWSDALLDLFGG